MQNQKTVFSKYPEAAGIETAGNKKETAMAEEIKKLGDQALLSQTKLLAQKERSLHIQVLRHLREIEARRLYFSEGFSSLFDYAVRELGYSAGAACRRIKAMRLCRELPEAEGRLKSGSLSLCAASQLQSFFEREKKRAASLSKARPKETGGEDKEKTVLERPAPFEGAGQSGSEAEGGKESGERQKSLLEDEENERLENKQPEDGQKNSPEKREEPFAARGLAADEEGNLEAGQKRALEKAQKLDLLKRAEGKSSRETERMLLERSSDSGAALPRDQARFLGNGKVEIKAVVDVGCHRALEDLKFLLSHRNPSMGYGELLGILSELGLREHDPRRKCQNRKRQSQKEQDQKKRSQEEKKLSGKNPPDREQENAAAPALESKQASCPSVTPALESKQTACSSTTPTLESNQAACSPATPTLESNQAACSPATPALESKQTACPHATPTLESKQAGRFPVTPALESKQASCPSLTPTLESGKNCKNKRKNPSRYIPAEVRRLVWARDRGRCSYVNPKTGQRCGSRYMLQMDHIKPYALGGRSTKENMRLLCAGHNRFRARETFFLSARSRPASHARFRSDSSASFCSASETSHWKPQ